MAGDCPHTSNLEATLQHCHDKSLNMTATHESYLKIIDDFKQDLEQISSEVIMVQNECNEQNISNNTDDIDLETSLKELETQNDRLEQALKLQTQTKDVALTELQTNNEALKYQIAHLKHTIVEQDHSIMQLRNRLRLISSQAPAPEYGHSHNNCCGELEKKIELLTAKLEKSTKQEQFLRRETRKFNEELNESKQKNADLNSKVQRLATLLKSQESHRTELLAKYEDLEKNFEDQGKKLRAASTQLNMLSDRLQIMEKKEAEHNMQRNLLREEVLSLKEKEACVMGKQKSMQEHILQLEKQLYFHQDVIKEQQRTLNSTQIAHSDLVRRLQENNADLKRKLSQLFEDYKKLQEEYDNQKEINTQKENLIKSYLEWKEHQLKADAKIHDIFQTYANHIKLLIEDKAKILENNRDLYKTCISLQNELGRLKVCPYSVSNYNPLNNISESLIAERLEIVRQTARRVSEQSSTLKYEEEPPPLRGNTSTTDKLSEETM